MLGRYRIQIKKLYALQQPQQPYQAFETKTINGKGNSESISLMVCAEIWKGGRNSLWLGILIGKKNVASYIPSSGRGL